MSNLSINDRAKGFHIKQWLNRIRLIYLALLFFLAGIIYIFHLFLTWLLYLIYSFCVFIVFAWLFSFCRDLYRILEQNETQFLDLPFDVLIRRIREQWPKESDTWLPESYAFLKSWTRRMALKFLSWLNHVGREEGR